MVEIAARALIVVVCLLLACGLTRQFMVGSAVWVMLDHLAIVPQWKFFAQRSIDGNSEAFDDFHLLVRTAQRNEEPGEWRELLHYGERRWRHSVWNPRNYSRSLVVQHGQHLADVESREQNGIQPSGLSYLTVLRFCLDRAPLGQGAALQFAVAGTRGRGTRELEVRFVSAWHCP
jgi:hypothetical protein